MKVSDTEERLNYNESVDVGEDLKLLFAESAEVSKMVDPKPLPPQSQSPRHNSTCDGRHKVRSGFNELSILQMLVQRSPSTASATSVLLAPNGIYARVAILIQTSVTTPITTDLYQSISRMMLRFLASLPTPMIPIRQIFPGQPGEWIGFLRNLHPH
jgi:hypothetical protein